LSRNTAKLTVASSSGAFGAALAAGGVTQGTSEKKTKSSAYWAVGAQYDLNSRYGVRLEYENFGKLGNEDDTGRAKADLFSVNAVVRF
jgi:hypothetical protein